MIRHVLKDAALLADIRAASRDDGQFRLWWLGQSGFLLQWRGHHLLLDPYLSESLTKNYAETTPITWTRTRSCRSSARTAGLLSW